MGAGRYLERGYRNPRTDLRAASRGALAPLGVSQQGMVEEAEALSGCSNTARVRHISLSEVERERVDAPSEEAGESRERRESLEGDKKPMGVSIESAAAMHRHNTDSLVEQSLEAEAQSKKDFFGRL